MQKYAREFTMYMDSEGIKYTEQNENVIKVVYSGDNLDTISIYAIFDEDGDHLVQMRCWEIVNFKNNEAAAFAVCNELNKQFRWAKFYLDNDNDIVAMVDAILDLDTCGEECMELVRRMVSIIDDAYPQLAKARWA